MLQGYLQFIPRLLASKRGKCGKARRARCAAMAALPLVVVLVACGDPRRDVDSPSMVQAENRSVASTLPNQGPVLRSGDYLGGAASVREQGEYEHPFLVAARSGRMRRFPCGNCHDRPLNELKAGIRPQLHGVHRDIAKPHARAANLGCLHCHEDATGMNGLRLLDGSTVAFDHSYRLCAQCHFQQAKAWAGGGHGKRLAGWANPRVVENCAGCHNPHDPLRPVSTPRWPAVVPNAPAKRAGHDG